MPGYKIHSLAGLITAIVLSLFFSSLISFIEIPFLENFISEPINIIAIFGISILFALLPDIDTNSMGQDIFYSLFILFDIFLIIKQEYFYASIFGLFAMLPIVGKHRGWVHTWWAGLVFSLPFLIFPSIRIGEISFAGLPLFFAGNFGYFSHLLLDKKFFK